MEDEAPNPQPQNAMLVHLQQLHAGAARYERLARDLTDDAMRQDFLDQAGELTREANALEAEMKKPPPKREP